MITTFVEYDAAGELFHICQIETTEGHLPPPGPDATDEDRAAHAQAVQDAIAARANATRAELEAQAAAGRRLLVLPAGADLPEHGRHRVDTSAAKPKLARRTDAQLAAWQAAEQAKADAAKAQGVRP